ncbi:Adhesion G-protein coupled receptor G6 [Labeo rohita]|uniref:Adhesion G-protein coupled receptor G6 n=1 Tax=Labeo rohita TaxID=84645 RepID=A0ABQ8L4T8_LABRO|nr:Adhesion G-protein coupled receptor G6 [Labeo rohita]
MEGESEHREAGEQKKKKRKLKEQKTTEPAPLLVEVRPQQTQVSSTVRSSFLKPIEAELPMLPNVSEHFTLPATHFKPLPPVTKPPMRPQKPGSVPARYSSSSGSSKTVGGSSTSHSST